MTGPSNVLPPVLNNAAAAQELLTFLGIRDRSLRFEVIPSVLPVAIVAEPSPTIANRLAFGTANQVAIALENSMVQLLNPTGSGVIIHVDSALILSSAAAAVDIRQLDTPLTTNVATLAFRDRREAGAPSAQTRTQTNVGLLGTNRVVSAVDGIFSAVIVPIDAYLEPGQGILLGNETINRSLRASYYWEEFDQ